MAEYWLNQIVRSFIPSYWPLTTSPTPLRPRPHHLIISIIIWISIVIILIPISANNINGWLDLATSCDKSNAVWNVHFMWANKLLILLYHAFSSVSIALLCRAVMFDVFGPVKELLSLDPICIDNNIFRLHYKVVIQVIIITNLFVHQSCKLCQLKFGMSSMTKTRQCRCWANLCQRLEKGTSKTHF